MTEKITLYDATTGGQGAGLHRKMAVEAALEPIRAYAVSPDSIATAGTKLQHHLQGLRSYADLIQAALEPQNK
jgi:hypothetical protein